MTRFPLATGQPRSLLGAFNLAVAMKPSSWSAAEPAAPAGPAGPEAAPVAEGARAGRGFTRVGWRTAIMPATAAGAGGRGADYENVQEVCM